MSGNDGARVCGGGANAGDSAYEDIINLPHFHAPERKYMAMSERAAQFAPFKSLGRDNAVDEQRFVASDMTVELSDEVGEMFDDGGFVV